MFSCTDWWECEYSHKRLACTGAFLHSLGYQWSLTVCFLSLQYETAMACENPASIQAGFEDAETVQTGCENPSSAQSVAYHTVNRRYSEFLNLQTRLEEKTELRKLIKGTEALYFARHLKGVLQ